MVTRYQVNIPLNKVEIKDDKIYDSNVYEDESLHSNKKKHIQEEINIKIINQRSNSKNSQKSDDSIKEINQNIRKIEDLYFSILIN